MIKSISSRFLILLILFSLSYRLSAQEAKPKLLTAGKLIYEDRFSTTLDSSLWKVEMIDSAGDFVGNKKGKLILRTKNGVTVWLNKKLSGNIRISYDRKVILKGGALDRLSDLNQFWMASDPAQANLFTRDGILESYNNLRLYYVGMGGNYNTTTRFRKYDETGKRKLIAEYTDPSHLLIANKIYHIDLMVKDGIVSFWVDQHPWFSFHDSSVLTSGYFGFRSTKSNQEISHLRIYQL